MIISKTKRNIVLFVIYFIYLYLLITRFVSIKDCFSNPIITYDYALHYTNAVSSRNFVLENRKIWGYNPYHYAGYIDGVYQAVDNHFALLFQVLFAGVVNPALVFNISIIVGYALLPFFMYLGAKNYKLPELNALLMVFLTSVLLFTFTPLNKFIFIGMYSYVISIFVSFYASSLFHKFLLSENKRALIMFTITSAILLLIHPLSAIVCCFFGLGTVSILYRKINLNKLLWLSLSFVLILLFNLFWIYPYLKFSYFNIGFGNYWQTEGSGIMTIAFTDFVAKYFLMLLIFLISLVVNFYINRRMFVFTVVTSSVTLLISFYGTQLGLSFIEPHRYLAVFFFILLISISSIAAELVPFGGLFKFYPGFVVLVLLAFSDSLPILYCNFLNPYGEKLLEQVEKNVSNVSRLQIEMGYKDIEIQNYMSHYYGLIPDRFLVESLSGLHPVPPENVVWSQFVDGRMFGELLNDISYKELENNLNLYNVGYIVASNENSKDYLEDSGFFELVYEGKDNNLYRYTNAPNSYCYGCEADVTIGLNRINVSNADRDEIVLKYHYFDILKAVPESVQLFPIYLSEDPVPFIMVKTGGVKDFIIYGD